MHPGRLVGSKDADRFGHFVRLNDPVEGAERASCRVNAGGRGPGRDVYLFGDYLD
jgi:hypothetical protein